MHSSNNFHGYNSINFQSITNVVVNNCSTVDSTVTFIVVQLQQCVYMCSIIGITIAWLNVWQLCLTTVWFPGSDASRSLWQAPTHCTDNCHAHYWLGSGTIKNTGKANNNNMMAVIDVTASTELSVQHCTVHWQCSVGTGCVFRGTLVCNVHVAYHFPRTVLISAARMSPIASMVMIASPMITIPQEACHLVSTLGARNPMTTKGATTSAM